MPTEGVSAQIVEETPSVSFADSSPNGGAILPQQVLPPSTTMTWPVVQAPAREAR